MFYSLRRLKKKLFRLLIKSSELTTGCVCPVLKYTCVRVLLDFFPTQPLLQERPSGLVFKLI